MAARGRRGEEEGMTFEAVVTVALFSAVLLFIIMLLGSLWLKWSDGFADRETCKLSVETYTALQVRVWEKNIAPTIVDFDCSRRLISINKDHIELNSKKASFFDGRTNKTVKRYDKATPEIVESIVADEIAGCWYQYMEGKVDMFGEHLSSGLIVNDKRLCGICSEITFSKELRGTGPYRVQAGLFGNLKSLQVRPKFSADQQTLWRYIFNDETICNPSFNKFFEDSASCLEHVYLTFATDEELKKPKVLGATVSTSDVLLPLVIPMLRAPLAVLKVSQYVGIKLAIHDRPFKLFPSFSPDEKYVVVFIREGGSKWVNGESSTNFVWVVESSKLSSDFCDQYFAG